MVCRVEGDSQTGDCHDCAIHSVLRAPCLYAAVVAARHFECRSWNVASRLNEVADFGMQGNIIGNLASLVRGHSTMVSSNEDCRRQ